MGSSSLPNLILICEPDASPEPGDPLSVPDSYTIEEGNLLTFKEQQKALTESQHKLAVWEFLYKFLDENFIARDGGNPKKAIKAYDCLIEIVPEDIIEDVLQYLAEDKIAPIQQTIKTINDQEMVIVPNEKEN